MPLSLLAKNVGFLVKYVPLAAKKAESHFNKAIEVTEKIGAKILLSQAYLGLGFLHKAKKRSKKARECLTKANHIFEECEAEVFLKQTQEALEDLR